MHLGKDGEKLKLKICTLQNHRSCIFPLFFFFPTCFRSFYQHDSTPCCWQTTLPIIPLQHKACRWCPQVPAWKTADLGGTSCLINSSHKWGVLSNAQTDIRHHSPPSCQQGCSPLHIHSWRASWKFLFFFFSSHNLLKHGISLWSFAEDSLPFSCDGTLISRQEEEFRAAQMPQWK